MVIFIFLRHLWATIIPSITVPLAIVGTFGVMYVCDYSIDNLSLMGLTIAVGFVVDDAIVMIENIVRYIEQGERPLFPRVRGRGHRRRRHVGLRVADTDARDVRAVPHTSFGREAQPRQPDV